MSLNVFDLFDHHRITLSDDDQTAFYLKVLILLIGDMYLLN